MNKKLLFSPQASSSKRPPLLLILQAKKEEEVLQTKKGQPLLFLLLLQQHFSAAALLCYSSPLEAKDLIGSENVLFYQIVKNVLVDPVQCQNVLNTGCPNKLSNWVVRQDLLVSERTQLYPHKWFTGLGDWEVMFRHFIKTLPLEFENSIMLKRPEAQTLLYQLLFFTVGRNTQFLAQCVSHQDKSQFLSIFDFSKTFQNI